MSGQEEALEEMAHGATEADEGTGPGPKRRGGRRTGGESACEERGARRSEDMALNREERAKYHRWLQPDGLTMLRAWARDGLSERQIAGKCGVAHRTLARWKRQYPEIAEALNYDGELANAEVESALHSLAVGYTKSLRKTYKVKHVEYGENGRKLREYEELETGIDDVHVPPNMSAQKFWLEKRAPEAWGDEVGRGDQDECVQPVQILCDILREGNPPDAPGEGGGAAGKSFGSAGCPGTEESGSAENLDGGGSGVPGMAMTEVEG
ncbi:MAG: helix-turn-helix domain-containing protein [Clostridia bacterium]|nr:helix-turn-helix domain-containing protein [Clostridia bacterium]